MTDLTGQALEDAFTDLLDVLWKEGGYSDDSPTYQRVAKFHGAIQRLADLDDDTKRMEWLAANMRSLWEGRKREYRTERGDYRLPDIGLVESERTHCTVKDLRKAIDDRIEENNNE